MGVAGDRQVVRLHRENWNWRALTIADDAGPVGQQGAVLRDDPVADGVFRKREEQIFEQATGGTATFDDRPITRASRERMMFFQDAGSALEARNVGMSISASLGASGRGGMFTFERRIEGTLDPVIMRSVRPSEPRSPARTSGP